MFRAGIARSIITPPIGMTMAGYAIRNGVAEDKDGELYATALVLDDGHTRVAILGCDLLCIQEPFASELREAIGQQLETPPSHVLLNTSHTHCGPTLGQFQYDDDEHQEGLRRTFSARLRTEIPALCAMAVHRTVPARIGTGVGEARIGINRRELDSDGRVFLGENPSGPVDHQVRVIRVDDLQGKPIAVAFAHGCHTVTMGPKCLRWSADYVGPARELIERSVGALSVFLQANAGDINPVTGIGTNEDNSNEKIRLGLTLGSEVLKVHSSIYTESTRGPRTFLGSLSKVSLYPRLNIERQSDCTIAVQEEPFELPLQQLPDRQLATQIWNECESEVVRLTKANVGRGQLSVARRYRNWAAGLVDLVANGRKAALSGSIQVVRIGELSIAAVPGETFSALGMEVRQRSPFANTLFLGYSNGCIGYIPTSDAFPKEGWSVKEHYNVPDMIFQGYLVPTALAPVCSEIVVSRSLRLLQQLRSSCGAMA
jgi:neutral ceramidase